MREREPATRRGVGCAGWVVVADLQVAVGEEDNLVSDFFSFLFCF